MKFHYLLLLALCLSLSACGKAEEEIPQEVPQEVSQEMPVDTPIEEDTFEESVEETQHIEEDIHEVDEYISLIEDDSISTEEETTEEPVQEESVQQEEQSQFNEEQSINTNIASQSAESTESTDDSQTQQEVSSSKMTALQLLNSIVVGASNATEKVRITAASLLGMNTSSTTDTTQQDSSELTVDQMWQTLNPLVTSNAAYDFSNISQEDIKALYNNYVSNQNNIDWTFIQGLSSVKYNGASASASSTSSSTGKKLTKDELKSAGYTTTDSYFVVKIDGTEYKLKPYRDSGGNLVFCTDDVDVSKMSALTISTATTLLNL